MRALREGCVTAGFKDAKTFIATGNILFTSSANEASIVRKISSVVVSFGLDNEVFVRSTEALGAILKDNPFADAARDHPNHLVVLLLAQATDARALESWPGPERVAARGRDIYIDYPVDIGTSKLTPSVIERRLGAKGTARNWNTMSKMALLCYGDVAE